MRHTEIPEIHQQVQVQAEGVALEGMLSIPAGASGLVVFVHGSGSSRLSPRNQSVAQALQQHHLGTLLFDLLTDQEESADEYNRQLRFDIPLLSKRVMGALDWLAQQEAVARHHLRLGCFGASTGAAAALIAAAGRPDLVRTVVSRGGRPDLAVPRLPEVRCPVLLLVGGDDTVVIEMNRHAAAHLNAPHRLEIIPGASHLFSEPGKLEDVASQAAAWFERYLAADEEQSSAA
jgi:dienelactone hydrolase